jgi:peptide/nickel transport system permease protein
MARASVPIVTILGLNFGASGRCGLNGVFAPWSRKVVVDAIIWKDFPVAQGGIFVIALMFLVINLATDQSMAS